MIRKTICAALAVSAASLLVPPQAEASQVVSRWFNGNWQCRIDGRPAQMRWEVRSKTVQNCSGGTCSQAQIAYYQGWFSDNGARFVPLTHVSSSTSTLTLRHADGNTWFLRYSGGRANGHTTWNGRRYPLSCSR